MPGLSRASSCLSSTPAIVRIMSEAKPTGAFFGRRKGHPLRQRQAALMDTLLPRLRQKQAEEWRKTIEGNVQGWWKILEQRAKQPAKPVNPQRVTWELSPLLRPVFCPPCEPRALAP